MSVPFESWSKHVKYDGSNRHAKKWLSMVLWSNPTLTGDKGFCTLVHPSHAVTLHFLFFAWLDVLCSRLHCPKENKNMQNEHGTPTGS